MPNDTDDNFATRFAERYAAARAHLRREMDAIGLYERDGWRITETTRQARNGLELVLRPIHRTLASPDGLECIVWIDVEGHSIDAECVPGGRPGLDT